MPSLRGNRWPRSGPSTQKKERTCNFFTKYVQGVRAHPPDKLPAVFEPAVTRRDAPVPRTIPPMWRRSASVRPISRSTFFAHRSGFRESGQRLALAIGRTILGTRTRDEERRSHSEARSRSLRLLARQS